MPDISMCNSKNCPSAEQCLRNPRSGTQPGMLQSWGDFEQVRDGKEKCSFFISIKGWRR